MHLSPRFELAGLVFDIPTMIMTVVTSLVVLLLLVGLTRKLTVGAPSGGQNFLEWVIDFVTGIAQNFMDTKTASRFITLGFTLLLYIFIGNQLGLLFNVNTSHHGPVSDSFLNSLALSGTEQATEHKKEEILKELADEEGHGAVVVWWKSPTATPSVTFALAFLVLLYSQYLEIAKRGLGTYLKHFLNPIHLLEEIIIKPLTLPLRLFGNIFAGEVLISFLLSTGIFVGSLPLVVWLGYSFFVGSVQAYIFTTLTMVYLSQKVNDEH